MQTEIRTLSEKLGDVLLDKQWHVTTAESCTGGGIAQAITAVPGSSQWFSMGFVTYSNLAKQQLLAVPDENFNSEDAPGAVSEETATAMACGALQKANAQLAVSTSGIAGPDGGSAAKPVGMVWIAWAWWSEEEQIESRAQCFQFSGDRETVRELSVTAALEGLLKLVNT